jgi:hypothetical protein
MDHATDLKGKGVISSVWDDLVIVHDTSVSIRPIIKTSLHHPRELAASVHTAYHVYGFGRSL